MFQLVIDFFSGISKDSWREVVITSFLIPLAYYLFTKSRTWLVLMHPRNLVLANVRKSKKDILIFLSQLSGAIYQDGNFHSYPGQRYIAHYPRPIPQDINNVETSIYQNINLVWSNSDGQCVAEIFNLLGQIKRHKGFRIADTIRDWNEQTSPIFSIGFNPKTIDLMSVCSPINFQKAANGMNLSIQGRNLVLGANYPDDAGIVQKTFMRNSNMPVFILAGLGTTGTEAAGKVLNENSISFGKLYGSRSFCVLFKTDITRGSGYYKIMAIFPKPKQYRALWYPITFIKWHQKKLYPTT